MKPLALILFCAWTVSAGDGNPIVRAWLINPAAQAAAANPGLRAVLPNVQNVRTDDHYVYVESAGLSLQSLGALEAREPSATPQKFAFRLPRQAHPAANPRRVPLGPTGVFLNGVPFRNPVSSASYRDQNLWHFDSVASLTQQTPPLLASLLEANGRHSPLIGFALDGYPVYGPNGWDAEGRVQRFRSSYRPRSITRRVLLPDGTELSPSQEGPPVNTEFPLGSFVEDYEFIQGSGDLDEHNGRFAKTPEYPDGTYAYFLAFGYPYLVGPTYYGELETVQRGPTASHPPLDHSDVGRIELLTPTRIQAGTTADLTFAIRDQHGRNLRFLERVHEKPIHLLIVSTDLAEFAHIHPELQPDDTYAVRHTFAHGGEYSLFVDHTPPGSPQIVSRFRLAVNGSPLRAERLHPETASLITRTEDGMPVTLTLPATLRAGKDLDLRFDLPVNDLEPYLGAWAHIMIVSEDRRNFIHAHPLDAPGTEHTHAITGPSPSTISTITGFRQPGIYRLWIQFQRQGRVTTVPYTIQVQPAEGRRASTEIPVDAIRVQVTSSGFSPGRITHPAGRVTKLAFTREDAQSCASSVVFPDLGIRRALPAGETVVVELPASAPRELSFACGMNMYRGTLLIR